MYFKLKGTDTTYYANAYRHDRNEKVSSIGEIQPPFCQDFYFNPTGNSLGLISKKPSLEVVSGKAYNPSKDHD
jgi:hypothetical protein